MKRTKIFIFLTVLLSSPLVVFGATGGFRGLLLHASSLISQLIILVVSLALLAFFWGLTKYIWSLSGDKKNYEEGINIMKWGILALFVMLSIWGLVGFLQKGFGLDTTASSRSSSILNGGPTDPPCSNFNPDLGGPCQN